MDFTLTDDERAVTEAAAQVAGAADPWAALEEGGWLDILLEDERGIGYLGLVAEALGAAGVAVPLAGTAVVWPTLFGGTAGGRRVGVADTLVDDGGAAAGPRRRRLLCEDGVGADVVVVLRGGKAGIHETFSVEPVGGLEGDGLARLRLEGKAVDRCKDPELVAEARRRATALTAAEMAGAIDRIAAMTAGLRDRAPAVRPAHLRLPGRGPWRGPAGHPGAGGDVVGPAGLHVVRPVRHRGRQRVDLGGVGRGRRPGPSAARRHRLHRGVRAAAAVQAAADAALRLRRRPVPPPRAGEAGLMDYTELLAGRRSTRRFDTSRDVPDELLERVLAAPLAMPHAGNTYDWRGIVLRRRDRDPATWPAVFSALLEQSYVEEAAVVIAYAVQPGLVGGAVPGQRRHPRRAGPDRPRPPPGAAGDGRSRSGRSGRRSPPASSARR